MSVHTFESSPTCFGRIRGAMQWDDMQKTAHVHCGDKARLQGTAWATLPERLEKLAHGRAKSRQYRTQI